MATLTSRHECKYFMRPELMDPVRAFIRPFVDVDSFANRFREHRYPICSLYLDTPDLSLYHGTIHGHKNRYKLRVRSYSDEPDASLFFEVKRRLDGIVMKRRWGIDRPEAVKFLTGHVGASNQSQSDDDSSPSEFQILRALTGARPVIRVKYMREPYNALGGTSARITFDTDLHYSVTPLPDVSLNGPGWNQVPLEGPILEIKFTGSCPAWVGDLIRKFDLRRISIPKYCLSISRAIRDRQLSVPSETELQLD
jgi:hypothetical protein